MKTHRLPLILIALSCLAAPLHAEDAPVARAYLNWVLQTLDRTEADLASITAAAELAASPFVAEAALGVRGNGGINEELGARAGGLVSYRSTRGKDGDVILYFFGIATAKEPDAAALLDRELTDAEKLRDAGSVVIGIASLAQLQKHEKLERARQVCSALLDHHAPADDGLFERQGRAVVPTHTVAAAIAGWTWTAEFFAACTRLGKTPAMYKSVAVDPGRGRYDKYQGVKFHGDEFQVQPQEAGKLGLAYVRGLRALLQGIGDEGWPGIVAVSRAAADTRQAGGKVYVYAGGHYPPYHLPGLLAADHSDFTTLGRGSTILAEPGPDDLALAIGYCWPPGSQFNGRVNWGDPDKIRKAGRGVAWVAASYAFQPGDVRAGEWLIDQRWAAGDAIVEVPGYDVNICPPSGVIADTLLWCLTAQILDDSSRSLPASK